MTGRALTNTRRPAEPWRQRLIRSLLYGRNVDRAAKDFRVQDGSPCAGMGPVEPVVD